MEKRTPVQKSIIRHKLKEIDKKFNARKIHMAGKMSPIVKAGLNK